MTYIEERTYLPDGMQMDDTNRSTFQIGVFYRGGGNWMVAPFREGGEQLSKTGKWLYYPLKMTAMRWCRFDFETACGLAEAHINSRRVMGTTWAEWEAKIASQEVAR